MKKEDAEIDLNDDQRANFLKTRAYSKWPRAHFFTHKDSKKIRVIIAESRFAEGKLVIERVIPEGKKEMAYEDFLSSL